MKSNNKVIHFLELTYYTIIKSPLKFDYSIQGTMNRIIKEKNCKNLIVEKISDDIFVDGNTFLKKVTYLEDIKKYNYLGFHYDFIYGIRAKLFRIKELNLYSEDEKYSLSTNKYISLGYALDENIKNDLNHFLCIANKTDRIAILPKIRNSISNPYYISYILKINILSLERKYGKKYRVSSFLDNKNIHYNFKNINNTSSLYNLKKYNNQLIILSNISFASIKCDEGDYIVLDSQWQRKRSF